MFKTLKIPMNLFLESLIDLKRPHDFAHERIGFFICTVGDAQLTASDWLSIKDKDYILNDRVGAMVGESAMECVMQRAFTEQKCLIHFHLHEFQKIPTFSIVDLTSLSDEMIPSLFNFSKAGPHGALIKGSRTFATMIFYSAGLIDQNIKIVIGENYEQ